MRRPPLLLHLQPPPRRAPPSPAAPTPPSTLSSSRSTTPPISTPSSRSEPFHSRSPLILHPLHRSPPHPADLNLSSSCAPPPPYAQPSISTPSTAADLVSPLLQHLRVMMLGIWFLWVNQR
uniref:Uncharacterized protein n=1 Tax=Helianthus annuus TaxID=4232 RepID=A0A251V2Q7_HELAN